MPADNGRAGRARAAAAAVTAGQQQTRGHQQLIIDDIDVIAGVAGDPVGVELTVHLIDTATGQQLPVDPARRIINPPSMVVDERRRRRRDPAAALWDTLWGQVISHPGRAPRTTGGG